MKNFILIVILFAIFNESCKNKKAGKEESPISALSIIKGQLNDIDTSFYEIKKYESAENKKDTSILKREEVRKLAAPFSALPDITIDNYYKNYTEDRLIDPEQSTLSITSIAKNEDAEIQKQIIIVGLEDITNGKVQSIYIDRLKNDKDSSIEEKLFWQLDNYFTIWTAVNKDNQPEKTHLIKVEWK